MGLYLLKRLWLTIPFSVLIVLFSLLINQYFFQPYIDLELSAEHANQAFTQAYQDAECRNRNALHLDLPIFYFSIQSSALPDALQAICASEDRAFITMLCLSNGNTKAAMAVYDDIKRLSLLNESTDYDLLFHSLSLDDFKYRLSELDISQSLYKLVVKYEKHSNYLAVFLPSLSFYGNENQFNYWFIKALKFDFGKSSINNLPVSHMVNSAMIRTISFTIPAIVLIFLLAIPIGIFTSFYKNRVSNLILNFLYFIDAIPLFWVSILLISLTGTYYFTASQYGFNSETISLLQSLQIDSLAILALLIVSLPYVTKQVDSSINFVKGQAYIQTAFAMGIPKIKVIRKHILPNAALPIVTLLFNFLSAAFGGAFVVEMIFSIHGIGKLMADSVLSNDYQVVTLILLYLIFIKMLLMIVSDAVIYMFHTEMKFK